MIGRYALRLSLPFMLLALAAPAAAVESDQEPVDPAEFRPQTLPPERPVARAGGAWVARGPAPTQSAQVSVPPNFEVCGAIQSIAAHPTDANIIYIGAVNGGIWKTTNGTAAQPTWTPQTNNLASQSIGAIAFDPTDGTRQTLIAGTGRLSNFAQRGDDELGVYRTTNGGANWTLLGSTGSPNLLGQKFMAVAARGATLLAASRTSGLFRSTNTGATWTLISGTGNLPTGGAFDLVADPFNSTRFYISVSGAMPTILRSDDTGASWINVTTGVTGLSASTSHMRMAVGASSTLYLAVVNSGVLARVFRSANQGGNWTAMDVPAIHPGGQGFPNTAIAADPANANLVYISGDRITVGPFTGNVVRGNFANAAGSQFTTIMDGNAGNTAPHADSRSMVFDVNGNILESDDGGIYRRSSPTSSAGTWTSVIGNLNVMEVHDLAHDKVGNILTIGTQDNGTHMQQTSANLRWTFINSGDGGDVATDDISLAAAGSFRYISSQNFGGFRRANYNAANVFVSNLSMPVAAITDPQFVTPIELNVTDRSRMLVGGVNTIYEYTGANTATPVLTSLGAPGANRNAMAFGSATSSLAAYVGRSAAVHKRSGNVFVATTALPAGAATVTDVAMDPDNDQVVFAVDDNQVFRSINGGSTWTDVTGNLGSISSFDFRTIEFIPDGNNDSVVLGTRSGVYSAGVNSSTWALFGSGLPNVLVFDLRYVASNQTLYAGTLGRGVWSTPVTSDNLFRNGFE